MLSDAVLVFCRSNGLFVVPIRARRMGVNANVFVSPYLLPKHYLPDIFTYIPNVRTSPLKGILHQKNFYRPNLIFWIVMGCGIARFGRRGLKTTET